MGTHCLSQALPREKLENILLAAGGLHYPSRGWEERAVAWPGLYPAALEGFWLLCKEKSSQ